MLGPETLVSECDGHRRVDIAPGVSAVVEIEDSKGVEKKNRNGGRSMLKMMS